jgi:hypothetical protein
MFKVGMQSTFECVLNISEIRMLFFVHVATTGIPDTVSSTNSTEDKVQNNKTEAEIDDPFTWFVGGICSDCFDLMGKHPTFGNDRLRLTPASLYSPYEGMISYKMYILLWGFGITK